MKNTRAAIVTQRNPCNAAVFALLAFGSMVAILTLFGDEAAAASAKSVQGAVAVLHPTLGNNVSGVVHFIPQGDKVLIEADVEGLEAGKHGFHIHEYGDCSSPDGKSAGGHYNPDGNPHAGPDQKNRHMGDMGNLEADASGQAHYERQDDYIVLTGEKSIIGRAIIVHSGEDDLTSQPTGDAGSRVACGVIGFAGK